MIFHLIFTLALALAQEAHYRHSGPAVLPDPAATPGEARPTTRAALCSESFHTADERHTTPATKRRAYELYGVEPYKGMCRGGCEVDHLISLEIGGADTLKNLWPQPSQGAFGYHLKDKLENRLHRMICDGKISLPEAQKCIASDWYACGLRLKVFDRAGKLLPLEAQ
jgi:hypothetical protein